MYFKNKDTQELKISGQKIYHVNIKHKKVGVAKLISHETNCMTVSISKAKEGYFTMTKTSVHQEGITIVNMYETQLQQK